MKEIVKGVTTTEVGVQICLIKRSIGRRFRGGASGG